MAVVYRHIRLDSNQPFYIGIGKTEKRAYENGKRRSAHWNNIVQKYGYAVQIMLDDLTWEEACEIEQYLICFYGRQDLGKGGLINLTDGGEGVPGRKGPNKGKKQSEESNAKRSAAMKGKPKSEETKAKMRAASLGKIISEEQRAKARAALKGKKRPPITTEHRANLSAAVKAYYIKMKNANNPI